MSEEAVVLRDVELMWAFFDRKNELSGKYQVDLVKLTDDHVNLLKSIGVGVRTDPEKPEKGKFCTSKSAHPIRPVDKNGDFVEATVGNGSVANIRMGSYAWTAPAGGKKGVSPSIKKMLITKLVEYNDDSDLMEDDISDLI